MTDKKELIKQIGIQLWKVWNHEDIKWGNKTWFESEAAKIVALWPQEQEKVCRWTDISTISNVSFRSSCGHEGYLYEIYDYCPHCGGKIEVVR